MKIIFASTCAHISIPMLVFIYNAHHPVCILLMFYYFECRIKEIKVDFINFHQATLTDGHGYFIMCGMLLMLYLWVQKTSTQEVKKSDQIFPIFWHFSSTLCEHGY